MPRSAHIDEIEEAYEQMDEILTNLDIKDNLMILRDWNAVAGEEETIDVVGKF